MSEPISEKAVPEGDGGRDVIRKGRRVADDFNALSDSVSELVEETSNYVRGLMRDRPYLVLGVAAGAGYLLGGGLKSRLTGAMLSLGGRMFLRNVTRRALYRTAYQRGEQQGMEH